MTVRIITDSTSDLPESVIKRYNIRQIPLNLHFSGEIIKDGEEIWAEEFYHRIANEAVKLQTSPPSVEDFIDAYRSMGDPDDQILSIHLSSRLSQTYVHAFEAAKLLKHERRIAVVDSEQVSMGLGWMVWESAKYADQGMDQETIIQCLSQTPQALGVFFSVEDLEPLYHHGRVGMDVLPEPGSYLRPILTVDHGELIAAEMYRGPGKRGHRRLLELLHAKMKGRPYRLAILQADCQTDAEELRQMAMDDFNPIETMVLYVGPSSGVYVGAGALGVAGLPLDS